MEDQYSFSEVNDKLSTSTRDETLTPDERKYRFRNRRRHGAMITISNSDYLLMSQKKSLKYYDARSGAVMEIRLAKQCDDDLTISCGRQPNTDKEMSDIEGSLEVHSEAQSCVTYVEDEGVSVDSHPCSNSGDDGSFQAMKHTFSFSARPKATMRRNHDTKKKACGLPSKEEFVATPKQIREHMQVDGLTNDEVKSHLQKYRLHVRKLPANGITTELSTDVGADSGDQLELGCSTMDLQHSSSPKGPLHSGMLQKCNSSSVDEDEEEKSDGHSWKAHHHT